MRNNSKKNQNIFVTNAIEKVIAIGAVEQEPIYDARVFRLDNNNPATITIWPTGKQDTCYSVFVRFNTAIPKITGPSGKYNFHENGQLNGPKGVLDLLDYHLSWVVGLSNRI